MISELAKCPKCGCTELEMDMKTCKVQCMKCKYVDDAVKFEENGEQEVKFF